MHVLLFLLILVLVLPLHAKETLILSHNQDRSTAAHKAMDYMAKHLYDATNGDVTIKIYPNSQLGNQRESMELMLLGAIDMVKSNAADLESFAPAYGAFNLPYLFNNSVHYQKTTDGEIGQQILLASEKKGFIGLTYYDAGARSFYTNKIIKTPADLAGLKIRVQPSASAIKMVTLLGALPTPLSYSELYTALQQSVVDGAENNIMALTKARHGEVSKIYTLDEHTMIPDVILMSSRSLNKLTNQQQSQLKAAAKASSIYMRKLWAMDVLKEEKKAKSMGVTFNQVDKKLFKKAVKPMHDTALQHPIIGSYIKEIKQLAE